MTIDAGILTGITGALLATISLVYARTQALAQRRQVEEMQRQTEHIRRAQHFETSHALMKDAMAARQEWVMQIPQSLMPPKVLSALGEVMELLDGDWRLVFVVRMYVEQLQEMFLARKADLVADEHWRAMHALMRGFFTPDPDRLIFRSFTELGWVIPEFAEFGRDFIRTGLWIDPLGRLEPLRGTPLEDQMPTGEREP